MKELIMNGEDKYIEYKREYTKTLLKTISAYANSHDGYIIVGIDDSGNIIGVTDFNSVRLSIENAINDNIFPKPFYEIYIEEYEQKKVVILKVYKGDNTPYTIDNKAYKRMDTSTIQVDKIGYDDLVLRGRNLSYEVLHYQGDKLSFNILGSKLREQLNIGIISEDILKSLELLTRNEYTNAAALLSDHNPLPNSNISLIRFDGNSVMNIKDRFNLSNISIITQFEKSIDFYHKHINKKETIDGAYRKTIEEIPLVAYREAIANAIVHRDYSRAGEIKVEIFDNRVEVISPGGLPLGISEEEFIDGKISIPRNRIISDIFLRLSIIERLATGIRRIKEYYKNVGLTPVFEVSENAIKVVLPKIGDDFSIDEMVDKNRAIVMKLEGKEKNIVEYIEKNGSINRVIAEKYLGLKKTQTIEIINTLQRKGIIIKIGSGKNTVYIINK
ncbi:MAG: hypothetical protein CVU84_15155 [Firmicutes bacterium HGW-Firmicutes-1]|jgi:ATP-dependent DNA helicase RecG|nr:MAG: hypothetical protein CVU84_15155 [Firmicutes bacterium HGW-Firmicutes-1]